jgi:hypothetical protein
LSANRPWWTPEDEEKWRAERDAIYLNGFTEIENRILLDDSLSDKDVRLLLALLLFNFKRDGVIWPSVKKLGRIVHDDYRNVSTRLRSLQRRGYIEIESVVVPTGVRNIYRFNPVFVKDHRPGFVEPQIPLFVEPQMEEAKSNKPREEDRNREPAFDSERESRATPEKEAVHGVV